ncbi:ABC transporter permease [Maricaulis parjimensis]|uniref:ABC transporter permease n=1 Tax=Maricaulis parjimensis TaxID=144023 RepID=UPI00193A6EC7|nr:ABC transporter permease [Maricaulis parjimensis]
MIRILTAEALKLRRSLVLLVAATPPVMVYLLGVLVVASGEGPDEWLMLTMSGAAVWAFFLMPMSAIGLTALMAQLEHGPSTWTHTLGLPVPRWQIFLAKAVVALLLMALVSLAVAFASWAAPMTGMLLSGSVEIQGQFDIERAWNLYSRILMSGLLVIAIQWTLAMRFRSFAVPVSAGIGGTFVAVAATSADKGIYFPWLMPVNVLASDPERAEFVIRTGLIGGVLVFAAAIVWLSRKDWR